MHGEDDEYIAYRHDKYLHTSGDSKLKEDEFPEDKGLKDFKWNKMVYNYNSVASSDVSFKRVKRQEDEEPEAPPPPPEAPPEAPPGTGEDKIDQEEPRNFATPIIGITVFFAVILIVGPFLVKKGPNRGIVQSSIMLSAFCMWIFWVTVYIGQMNPLIGPRLENTTLAWIALKLGNPVKPVENPAD